MPILGRFQNIRYGLIMYEEGKIRIRTERVLIKKTGEFIRAARRAPELFRQKPHGRKPMPVFTDFDGGIKRTFYGFSGYYATRFKDFASGCL